MRTFSEKISIVAPVGERQNKVPSATVSLCREVTEEHPSDQKSRDLMRSMDHRQLWGPGSTPSSVPFHAMGGSVVWDPSKYLGGPLYKWMDSCPRFHLHDYSLSELSLWLQEMLVNNPHLIQSNT